MSLNPILASLFQPVISRCEANYQVNFRRYLYLGMRCHGTARGLVTLTSKMVGIIPFCLTGGSVNADQKLGLRQRANRQLTGMMETARLAYVVSKALEHMSNE